jgi:ubiquinone/menaquinone biosynthesis C-methylase UbiE
VSRRVQASTRPTRTRAGSARRCRRLSAAAHAALALPHADPAKLAAPDAPEILVAGCGTGRHAADHCAAATPRRVLAVDISRASLAYAMRRCAELGLANIRFAQADLLELGALESAST